MTQKLVYQYPEYFPSIEKMLSFGLHHRFGRRKIFSVYAFFGGIICILAGVLSTYTGE